MRSVEYKDSKQRKPLSQPELKYAKCTPDLVAFLEQARADRQAILADKHVGKVMVTTGAADTNSTVKRRK